MSESDSKDKERDSKTDPSESRRAHDDRRIIKRYTDKRVVSHLKQINFWIKFLMLLLFGWGVYFAVDSFNQGESGLGEGFFSLCSVLFLIIPLYRYHATMKLYFENESVNNLEKCMERQTNLFMMLSFISLLFTVIVSL